MYRRRFDIDVFNDAAINPDRVAKGKLRIARAPR
jgi:hypothetical protein